MIIVQNESVVDTLDLQTKLERTKERFENCIIKKETEYAKLWNDWYKKYARNPLSQKLENENVELEFQVLNYARENSHLKATYKNLFDFISVSRAQTKTIVASLQNELQSNIYKNAKLRKQLFKKVSNEKDNTHDLSANTKFAKQPIVENLPKIGKTNSLSKPVTSSFVSRPQEPESVNNDKEVISNVACAMCSKCLISVNHDKCLCKYVNDKNSCGKNQKAKKGNILITRVYFVKGLGHNLFSVGQFCDSDLEVSFRRNACFVRNLKGVDLLKGDRSTSLYTINLHEMASASPICLMARASSTKSWLWHQRKSKRASHLPKPVPNSRQRLHLLHMDLCGPMRIASVNGKRYILVIVDDYSRYTWVHFLRSKDEAPENGVVKRRNRTLVEAARTMLIFSRAPLFLWAEAIATTCFTQNCSIIHHRFNKTPYELINGRKLDISFLHVFGALCYPKNDREDIEKLGAKVAFFFRQWEVPSGSGNFLTISRNALRILFPTILP
nr:hypothetical protein [Tanacetum cinerariifolium]